MTRRAHAYATDVPAVLEAVVAGEIVPFTRVGRERWTTRAKRYHGWKDRATDQLQGAIDAAGIPPYAGAVSVEVHLHRYSQRGDVDNLAKALADAANGVLWADDAQIVALVAHLTPCPRGDDRAVVIVTPNELYANELAACRRATRGVTP